MNLSLYNPTSLDRPMKISNCFSLLIALLISALFIPAQTRAQSKPRLTLDEFFNSVTYPSLAISPDGNSVVITVERADWDQQIFRDDLWLYRDYADANSPIQPTLIQLTQSGHDTDPKWSPDGGWIAFLSDRKLASEKDSDYEKKKAFGRDSSKDKDDKSGVSQIYLIAPAGGEAFPLTQGEEEVHSFTWSADSHTIYFSTRNPWTKAQKDEYKKQWKDVVQYRTAERGDTVFALDVAAALNRHANAPAKVTDDAESDTTPGAIALAASPFRVHDLIASPDGAKLAFLSSAINQREEKVEDYEIYVVENVARALLPATAGSQEKSSLEPPRRLTHNQAHEQDLHWANDSRHIFFTIEEGDISTTYRDLQPHLYWVDTETSVIAQWNKDFPGAISHYAVSSNAVLTSARIGTEVQMYSTTKPADLFHPIGHWNGTYANLSVATHSPRVAFVHSSLEKPEEIYLADSPDKLDQARPITSFNKLFTERELPHGKVYSWKADDGTLIEGMLIYPPGIVPNTPQSKHLPLFTFIHGGPNDADGNHFEADWYQWSALAATNGWLVFEPNYRGSTGYGDKFLAQIVPQLVSRPGKDILEGVDALIKDGIADPDHLTIGGYSYGGYLTNWLITQTTRFKAAVTGAGAVEHVGNWGNDDTTFDDAYFLGGRPWEAAQRYHDEAAIFQIDKVRTPTHMVAGANDIRVAVLEDYLLEHALYSLGIPNKLLIFPGEGHDLIKNPWHGKIKVREELQWLQKYGGVPAGN